MVEARGFYGRNSANWYSKLEAVAGINAVKGCVWLMEQIIDTPLNDEGERSYVEYASAALARAEEARAGFQNAHDFAFEQQGLFDDRFPLATVAPAIQKTGRLQKAYSGLLVDAERVYGGVSLFNKIALGDAGVHTDRLIGDAKEIIDTAVQLQPEHELIDQIVRGLD